MGITAALHRHAPAIKWSSGGIIILAIFLTAEALPLAHALQALKTWVNELEWWGPWVFGGIYVAVTVLSIPGFTFTIAAGALFGLWLGTLISSLAATVGAGIAFLLARYVAREKITQLTKSRPKLDAVDKAIGAGGWKVVALLRLSPLIPFSLQSYLYGLTPIRFWPYLLVGWLAMLPGTFMYAYIGHVMGIVIGSEHDRTTAEWVILGVGLVTTVVATVYITYLAKKKLREQASLGEEDTQSSTEGQSTKHADDTWTSRWPWGTTVAALAALLAIGTATYAQFNPDVVEELVSSWLGPPQERR